MDKNIEEEAKAARGKSARTGESYTIKGGASVVWGVAPTVAYGTITDFSVDRNGQFEKVENQYGAVVGIVIYDTEISVKLTVIIASADTPPAIGETVTIGGVTGVVTAVSAKASNKATKKYDITISSWANISLA